MIEKDTDSFSIGERIRECREMAHMTQKELGAKCGIDAANIRKYENGRQRPKLETVEKIAGALGVSVESLYYWVEPENFKEEKERRLKEITIQRAKPAIIELLKVIYGECECTAVYQLCDEKHVSDWYYTADSAELTGKRTIAEGDMRAIIDVAIATVSTLAENFFRSEHYFQVVMKKRIDYRVSKAKTGDISTDFLEVFENEYKEQKKYCGFDREISVEELDLAPAGDDLAPDDPGEADPAEKA